MTRFEAIRQRVKNRSSILSIEDARWLLGALDEAITHVKRYADQESDYGSSMFLSELER